MRKVGDRYDFAADAGSPVVASAGTFYLEWREGGERKRRAVGSHPREVRDALAAQAKVVSLRAVGMNVQDAPQIAERRTPEGRSILDVIASYNETASMQYAAKSRAKYRNTLYDSKRWAAVRQKTHLMQIGRDELIQYMGHLVAKQGLDHSTALDKGRVVHAVFNRQGADIRMKRGDWPRVTEQEINVYEPATLEKLFAAATPAATALFQTFRLTSFREQEIGFLAWDDFNPRRRTLSVTEKKSLGFRPKDKEERTIPIPDVLVELLEKHRKRRRPGCS